MSIPILPQLPSTDPSTSTIHDFLTNLSLSHTPLQIPASFYNNTAGASGGRGDGGTLYILPERSFRLLQAVMIACFIMLCLLSWLAAFLTTRKVGMLAVELGVWSGVRGWAERRRVGGVRDGNGDKGKRGKKGGEEGASGRGRGGGTYRQGEEDCSNEKRKTTEGNFLDRILFQFLLLHQNQPLPQQEGQTIPHRDREPEESPHHHQRQIPNQHPHPPDPPPPHLPTFPTLLITLLSLTKHIPLILCTSAPGNEILRWFIHLPEYAGVIIFMHGVWSLGAVVGVWGLLVWRGVRGKEIRRGRGQGGWERERETVRGLDGTVEECGLERGRGGGGRGGGRASGGGGWVVEVGMAV